MAKAEWEYAFLDFFEPSRHLRLLDEKKGVPGYVAHFIYTCFLMIRILLDLLPEVPNTVKGYPLQTFPRYYVYIDKAITKTHRGALWTQLATKAVLSKDDPSKNVFWFLSNSQTDKNSEYFTFIETPPLHNNPLYESNDPKANNEASASSPANNQRVDTLQEVVRYILGIPGNINSLAMVDYRQRVYQLFEKRTQKPNSIGNLTDVVKSMPVQLSKAQLRDLVGRYVDVATHAVDVAMSDEINPRTLHEYKGIITL
jgi:hypothetical protein